MPILDVPLATNIALKAHPASSLTFSLTSVQAVLIFAQHEHYLPLEDAAAHQSTADSGNVLVGLDLLELLC